MNAAEGVLARRHQQRLLERLERLSPNADGCLEWGGGIDANGYGVVNWHRPGKRYIIGRVHRIVWAITFGPIPPGKFVCHSCDNRKCANAKHLFLGTNRDNILDASRKGRLATGDRNGSRLHPDLLLRGADNPAAKLTAVDVKRIRRMNHDGYSQSELARAYAVSQSNISLIVRRLKWAHVS